MKIRNKTKEENIFKYSNDKDDKKTNLFYNNINARIGEIPLPLGIDAREKGHRRATTLGFRDEL
ncbi:hypothetical protein V1477_013167 [Vespula maculifrons]|uniref:Uncharacterized protein n=1 Tax=Vespula maculifrons TaxID=7453 RepID=A0ABD2BV51_VESMC